MALVMLRAGVAMAQQSPHVAIVQCEDSYEWSWADTQGSSAALVGLAGLIGVPYDTVLLDELLANPAPDYTSVWFSSCPVLANDRHAALDLFLIDHVGAGGNVFLDGPLALFAPDPQAMFGVTYRGMEQLSYTLEVIDGGWFPLGGYAITAGSSDHVIATRAGFEPGTQLSQGLIDGTETIDLVTQLDPDGAILLEVTSEADPLAYPMLVATTTGSGGRVVAIGSYGNYVGGASPFHNEEPRGYFDNQVLPFLLESLLWLEHGTGPAVGLQLSHAPMTAVGRLDGDWSGEVIATDETFLYLIDLAETTGLATAYGIVSDFVPDTGWEQIRSGAIALEAFGGALGSHSANHDYAMSGNLDDAGWAYETTGSLDEIRNRVSGGSFSPAVDVFINPGDTIESRDYYRFFGDIELFMSHGFETTAPYATGVMGFGLPAGTEPVAVVNNSPAPDFQWLYLEDWIYPVSEAADNQALILDYYQHTVQRGVLYNQMWHDYAIGGQLAPLNFPEQTARPLFDVNREHFGSNPVYMPSVDELVAKLHIAHKARHTSTRDGSLVTVSIDYTAVPTRYRSYANGMGVRIARAGGSITSATVDGIDHPAFTSDTVMLPAPTGVTQLLEVELGQPPEHPRLSFTSKPIDSLTRDGDALTVGWETRGLHRKACMSGHAGLIVLHAGILTRRAPETICGTVTPDSLTTSLSSTVIDTGTSAFFLDHATRPISAATLEGQLVTLTLADHPEGTLSFRTGGPPIRVELNGSAADYERRNGTVDLTVPTGPATVLIELIPCNDADGDGDTDCAGDCDDTDPTIGICDPPGGCCSTGGSPASSLLLTAAVLLLLLRRRRQTTWPTRRRPPPGPAS